jgi:Peptidase M50B-like
MATTWDPIDMEKVAFHEAGHAVVGWLFGLPLAYIYLDLEKEGGETAHQKACCVCLVQQIAFLYAGAISEEIFKGPAVPRRANLDRVNVHLLLERNGTPEEAPQGQALQTRAHSWAEELLRRHKARVGRVAKRLLQPPHKMNPSRFKQLMREG